MEKAATQEKALFTLAQFDWLGFDLDHTLIRYRLKPFHDLVFKLTIAFLIQNESYPASLAKETFNWEFSKKGVIVDKQDGNFLWIDSHLRITRAYHGYKPLTSEQIAHTYEGSVIQFDGISNERYWTMTSYYDTTHAATLALLVAWEDEQRASRPEHHVPYSKHADAVYNACYYNYYNYGTGDFFPEFERNTGEYVFSSKETTRRWLENIKSKSSIKLFLMTNSFPEFTDVLMKYSYGEDWRSLFDLIIYKAQKPHFYTREHPFRAVEGVTVQPAICRNLKLGGAYYEGNLEELWFHFEKWHEDQPERKSSKPAVCYFGDHLNYDVKAPKLTQKFKAVAIVEELDDLLNHLNNVKSVTNTEHDLNNKYWGSFFRFR